jgi:EH domain-containing protein 1
MLSECLSPSVLTHLQEEFVAIQREFHCHPGDFPDVNRYREILSAFDLSKFPKLEKGTLATVDQVLSEDVPSLMRRLGNPFTAD